MHNEVPFYCKRQAFDSSTNVAAVQTVCSSHTSGRHPSKGVKGIVLSTPPALGLYSSAKTNWARMG